MYKILEMAKLCLLNKLHFLLPQFFHRLQHSWRGRLHSRQYFLPKLRERCYSSKFIKTKPLYFIDYYATDLRPTVKIMNLSDLTLLYLPC